MGFKKKPPKQGEDDLLPFVWNTHFITLLILHNSHYLLVTDFLCWFRTV